MLPPILFKNFHSSEPGNDILSGFLALLVILTFYIFCYHFNGILGGVLSNLESLSIFFCALTQIQLGKNSLYLEGLLKLASKPSGSGPPLHS